MNVFESALPRVAFGCSVRREQRVPTNAWSAVARVEQQIRFGGKAEERSAEDFFLARDALIGSILPSRGPACCAPTAGSALIIHQD